MLPDGLLPQPASFSSQSASSEASRCWAGPPAWQGGPLSRENLRGGEYDFLSFLVADLHLSADLFDRRKQRLGLHSLLGTSPEVAALDDGAALIGKFKQFLTLEPEILCKNR